MISFRNDYSQGAHESVLRKLQECSQEQHSGYGVDEHCRNAADRIRELCQCPGAAVHFLPGGTQANLTVIASLLRPHQGVLCTDTAHIFTHETGAIEATGHKALFLPGQDGRLVGADVEEYVSDHYASETFEHMPQPGMVEIADATELGTVYSHAQMTDMSRVCRKYDLPLYLDGARLGYALAAEGNDLSFGRLAELVDVFTIGGTKQGALYGEALVIVDPRLQKDFRYHIKQRGGLMSKGFLMGMQFEALLEDDLYLQLSRYANRLAMRFRDAMRALGVPFLVESPTNQQFPIFANDLLEKLRVDYGFETAQKTDGGHTAVRFCFSWGTKEEDVTRLIKDITLLAA